MRKLLTLAMLSAFALAANAQTEKGKIIVGGAIGYSNSKSNNDAMENKQNSLTLLPSIGYFVKDNLALGVGIGYSRLTEKSSEKTQYVLSQKNTTDYFMVSPFIRHYINISDQFKFFGQFSVPMKWGNLESATGTTSPAVSVAPASNSKTTSIGVSIEPGFAYFPTKRIGIQLSLDGLSYAWNKTENKNSHHVNKTNAFNLGTNFFAPKIGIQFHF
ncbi:outer membrane beta-barrel protein [Pedobacter cryoconitis]|uniref:outer membrane beta-barrel protein n=1 Tax=Pedobacter cryoconitis TaxID=188932 RepID=UPI00161BC525|nr:outer membrane beta-barrel protein [Pedobacter cryoconitis]MBB5643841.1 long-subunit fatty acid transport protein [Pedobacter cryoconitis]